MQQLQRIQSGQRYCDKVVHPHLRLEMPQKGAKKSHLGCTRCKQRRVKCDERVPCGNCRRRKESCHSELQPTAEERLQTTRSSTQPWLDDLELMDHYSCSAFLFTPNRRPGTAQTFKSFVTKIALQPETSYLMHGILAVSALNLAYNTPHEFDRYMQLFSRHQDVALSTFRTMLTGINEHNAEAMYVLGALISVSSMAQMSLTASHSILPKPFALNEIIEMIVLVRGVKDVVRQGHSWISAGPLSTNVDGFETPKDACPPLLVQMQLDKVRQMLVEQCSESDKAQYDRELGQLAQIYAAVQYHGSENRIEHGVVLRWVACVSDYYLARFQARHPPAMVIMAHYVVLWYVLRETWYVSTWAERALHGISLVLDRDWQAWLKWPGEQLITKLRVCRTHQ